MDGSSGGDKKPLGSVRGRRPGNVTDKGDGPYEEGVSVYRSKEGGPERVYGGRASLEETGGMDFKVEGCV